MLSTQKISDTANFPGATLDPGDDFGPSLTSLGDLDGGGPSVRALAVGAAADRDDTGRALSSGTYFYRMTIDGRPVAGAGKALLLR